MVDKDTEQFLRKIADEAEILRTVHDNLVNRILENAPTCWDSSEKSPEAIAIEYVKHLEKQVDSLPSGNRHNHSLFVEMICNTRGV